MKKLKYSLYKVYHDWFLKDGTCSKWRQLEENQWLSPRELRQLQKVKLMRLLRHASRNVPYYKNICTKRTIKDFDDVSIIKVFPLLDKATIRVEFSNLYDVNKNKYHIIENSTSGSTGESLFFLHDRQRLSSGTAGQLRSYGWYGVSPFDKKAVLWGARFDVPPSKSLKDKLRQYSMPLLFLSSYDLSETKMRDYASKLLNFKPKLLTSYPSPLERFAEFCEAHNVQLPSLKAIVCSAEQLFDYQRKLFENVFNVPVFNRYGSREFFNVAHECEERRGLHVSSDRLYVEILDNEGKPCKPAQVGEVVITDLDNYIMPFIRYKTGDLAAWSDISSCRCGRGLPLLEKVEGRVFDLIRTKKGNVISGTFWTLLTKHISKNIRAFQVKQKSLDSIKLLLCTQDKEKLSKGRENALIKEINSKAPDLHIEIEYVENIPLTRSGKRRFVISEVE